jgi:hypothetical protein
MFKENNDLNVLVLLLFYPDVMGKFFFLISTFSGYCFDDKWRGRFRNKSFKMSMPAFIQVFLN